MAENVTNHPRRELAIYNAALTAFGDRPEIAALREEILERMARYYDLCEEAGLIVSDAVTLPDGSTWIKSRHLVATVYAPGVIDLFLEPGGPAKSEIA